MIDNAHNLEVIIRPGTSADAKACGRLYEAHLNWINVWHPPQDVIQRSGAVERVRYMVERHPSVVALIDNTVIGFVATLEKDPKVWEITHLYVDDPYRLKGIGTNLMKNIESYAAGKFDIEALLTTASSLYYPGKALPEALFRSLGYEVTQLTAGNQLYLKRGLQVDATSQLETKSSRDLASC